jgi:hypothetical protein
MTYENCIEQLRILLEATDPSAPIDKSDAIQKLTAACALVQWVTRGDNKARDQFNVYMSYYEVFALNLEGAEQITRRACEGELIKLSQHLPKK